VGVNKKRSSEEEAGQVLAGLRSKEEYYTTTLLPTFGIDFWKYRQRALPPFH
jgi:hypothetical protein